jgi:hypothetical protein
LGGYISVESAYQSFTQFTVVIPSNEKSSVPVDEPFMPMQRSHIFGVGMGEEQKMMDYEGADESESRESSMNERFVQSNSVEQKRRK